ncbi:MAG: hypothetical protein FWE24_05795 [Defluviitaleaceae bacterium]|nr:hypothetical protein [Defluviitaleaceae bacterium]
MFLRDEQKDAIGLTFILNEILPDSPYSDIRTRNAKFYRADEKQELLDEFYNISQILACVEADGDCIAALRRALMPFKNIDNILKKLERSYLHEIEFFDLKGFMLSLGKLKGAFSDANIRLMDVEFIDMEEALNILDPDSKRMAPFYLNEQYSEELWDVRKEKSRIERLIHEEKDKGKLEELKTKRTFIVAKEDEAETVVKKMLSEKLCEFLPVFRSNINAIGKLDFTIQKAILAKKYNAVCPDIEEDSVEFVEMLNPEVEAVLKERGKSFTPISIKLSAGTTLLTGANMGGKSVAVKTAVLNICLCHMGFFVFAKRAKIPIFDGIYLISEDMQSLEDGLSTFGAEIMSFNSIARQAEKEYLFIALDEFARSTNPEEGAVVVRAVSRFLNTLKSISIITTHYDNIAEGNFGQYQVAGLKNLDFENLAKEIENSTSTSKGIDLIAAHMDYRLIPVSGKNEPPRDALNICRLLGTPHQIMNAIEEGYINNTPKI